MRWEYLALTCQPSDATQADWFWTLGTKGVALGAKLDELGAKGWELVGIQMVAMSGHDLWTHPSSMYVFKRPAIE